MNNLGDKGENIAKEYLQENGYEILHTNWFFGHKELDIIARKKDVLHIIEVKTRTSNWQEESYAVHKRKQKNIIEATDAYVHKFNIEDDIQFDVIFILTEKRIELKHIEEAFSIYD